MDDATREEVDRWLVKARRDLDSARRLLQGVPPYRDTASYHCQQAAEKGRKAFLTAKLQPFPKTHDLTVLVKLAEPHAAEFAGLASAAVILTPYATLFRYPESVLEPDDDDVREALIPLRSDRHLFLGLESNEPVSARRDVSAEYHDGHLLPPADYLRRFAIPPPS